MSANYARFDTSRSTAFAYFDEVEFSVDEDGMVGIDIPTSFEVVNNDPGHNTVSAKISIDDLLNFAVLARHFVQKRQRMDVM